MVEVPEGMARHPQPGQWIAVNHAIAKRFKDASEALYATRQCARRAIDELHRSERTVIERDGMIGGASARHVVGCARNPIEQIFEQHDIQSHGERGTRDALTLLCEQSVVDCQSPESAFSAGLTQRPTNETGNRRLIRDSHNLLRLDFHVDRWSGRAHRQALGNALVWQLH